MRSSRALALFSDAADMAFSSSTHEELYRLIESSLAELIGFKLMTILRLQDNKLERLHTNDLETYPVGGFKDIGQDKWLQSMLNDGKPVISADVAAVRQHFVDHELILGLGCGSVLNVPVTCANHTLGSLNLLDKEGRFNAEHVLIARPYSVLLAAVWLADVCFE